MRVSRALNGAFRLSRPLNGAFRLSKPLNSVFKPPKYPEYDPNRTGVAHYVDYNSYRGRWNMFWVIISFWVSVGMVIKANAVPAPPGDPKQTEEFLAQLK